MVTVPGDGGVGRMGLTKIFFLVVALVPKRLCTKSKQSVVDVLSRAKHIDGDSLLIFSQAKDPGPGIVKGPEAGWS